MAARALTLFLAVMAVAGVVGAQDAFGCSCVPRSAQQVIDGADAAFTGTVVEVREAPGTSPDPNPDQPIDIRFRVEAVYRVTTRSPASSAPARWTGSRSTPTAFAGVTPPDQRHAAAGSARAWAS